MFILCPGTKAIYNADRLSRYFVDEIDEDEESMAENGEHWVIIGDADICAYHLSYYFTEDDANDAMLDMMKQMQNNAGWILLRS